MKKLNLFIIILFLLIINNLYSQDTFSITAIDLSTGQVGSAGASCVTDCTILTYVQPGWGVAHIQASWLQANYNYAKSLMLLHLSPQQILDSLIAHDAQNNPTVRQYGIIDLINGGRNVAYTGTNCINWKGHLIDSNHTFTIQGNILLGSQIIDSMKARFLRQQGSLAQKLMAALQGAKVVGADTRCASRGTSSQSAFIRVAKPGDTLGTLYLNLKVLNAPVNRDPIDSLQVLFNGWMTNTLNYENQIPDNMILYQNYPNPFNPSTNIKFSINKNSYVTIKIFDVSGKEITNLLSSQLNSGTYIINWEPYKLPSGVYYYRLEADGYADTKKMVLLK